MVEINLKTTTMASVAATDRPNIFINSPSCAEPSDSMNEWPPPIAYTEIRPNAPATKKGIIYLPAPLKKVIFLKPLRASSIR